MDDDDTVTMMRGWIPPLPLACGVLSFGCSWGALYAIARSGLFEPTFLALGWVHLVALGWITTIALAILLHAIPNFLDVEWKGRGASVARACTPAFAIAAIGLAAGFFADSILLLQIAGTVAFVALVVYVIAITEPLDAAMRADPLKRAVSRAFGITLVLLLVAGALGVTFTFALGGRIAGNVLNGGPPAHALLGIGGWLTLLVVGVSARTMGPIAGVRSRYRALHIGGSSALLFGTVFAALGAWANEFAVLVFGCALLLLGSLAYGADIADILLRATVRHRPPQAFMGFAAAWMIATCALLAGAVFGQPWSGAIVYAALIGWIGSAVLAHLHHIGVRVLLTSARGEADETQPEAVLTAPLTWCAVLFYQVAATVGTYAIAAGSALTLEVAAIAGFVTFAVVVVNLGFAVANARRLLISLI